MATECEDEGKTPDFLKHCARVYLYQARVTPHRSAAFMFLTWAARCRREAAQMIARPADGGQMRLF